MPTNYDKDVKAKAIRLVRDHAGDYDTEWLRSGRFPRGWGMSAETLCKWLRQAEVDAGQAPGVPTETAREIRELKRKNAELERTIEILKAATSSFARECDPLHR
jgi:transposase